MFEEGDGGAFCVLHSDQPLIEFVLNNERVGPSRCPVCTPRPSVELVPGTDPRALKTRLAGH